MDNFYIIGLWHRGNDSGIVVRFIDGATVNIRSIEDLVGTKR